MFKVAWQVKTRIIVLSTGEVSVRLTRERTLRNCREQLSRLCFNPPTIKWRLNDKSVFANVNYQRKLKLFEKFESCKGEFKTDFRCYAVRNTWEIRRELHHQFYLRLYAIMQEFCKVSINTCINVFNLHIVKIILQELTFS